MKELFKDLQDWKPVTDIKDEDIEKLKFEFGDSHAQSLLKHGFNEGTLPHKVIADIGLMHLFKKA